MGSHFGFPGSLGSVRIPAFRPAGVPALPGFARRGTQEPNGNTDMQTCAAARVSSKLPRAGDSSSSQQESAHFVPMHRLFGKSKPAAAPAGPAPSLGDANASMNKRIAEMDSQIKGFEDELRRYKEQISRLTGASQQTVKNRAMQTLRRKAQIEAQRDALTAQVMNVERTVFALETAKDTQTTVSALREATKQLKVEQEKINMSEVEDIQDDLAELLQDQEDLQEILGRSYGLPDGLDEADLEAELAGLEAEFSAAALEEPSSSAAANLGVQQQQHGGGLGLNDIPVYGGGSATMNPPQKQWQQAAAEEAALSRA